MAACTRVKSELQIELTSIMSQLASREMEVQTLKSSKEELETEVSQLKSSLQTLELTAAGREASLQQEITSKTSALASKEAVFKSTESRSRELEKQVMQMRGRISSLEQDKSTKDTELIAKETQLRALETSKRELESEISLLESANKTLEQERDTELSTRDSQIQVLRGAKSELETKVANLEVQVGSLEQDVTTVNAEVISKEVLLQALEESKSELELQVMQLQNSYRLLQQDTAAKEAELTVLQSTGRDSEVVAAQQQAHIKALEQANATLDSELSSLSAKIASLETSKRELETSLLDLRLAKSKLEEVVSSKAAELAVSKLKISTLLGEKENLTSEVEVMQKDLSTVKAKASVIESQASVKEGLISTLNKECCELRDKVIQLTEQNTDQKSSLHSVGNLTASLAAQKAEAESRCANFEKELKERDRTILMNETALSNYKSELETCKELLNECRQSRSSSTEESHHVNTLIRDNLVLQSKQTKLWGDLDAAAERERETSSLCKQLRAELASERAKTSKLMTSLEEVAGSHAPSDEDSISAHTSCSHRTMILSDAARTEEVTPGNQELRIDELKRRNNRVLPHLKSSYPIETQVKPETPGSSDSRLKYGHRGTLTIEQLHIKGICSGSPEQSVVEAPQQHGRVGSSTSSTTMTFLRDENYHIMDSSPRRLSAPPTPQPYADYRRKPLAMQSQTMCPSLNLREYLDNPDTGSVAGSKPPETQPLRASSSTAFEVTFSPPKAKGALPKRLQQKRLGRGKKSSSVDVQQEEEVVEGARRETVVKKADTSNKSQSRKKWYLRRKS